MQRRRVKLAPGRDQPVNDSTLVHPVCRCRRRARSVRAPHCANTEAPGELGLHRPDVAEATLTGIELGQLGPPRAIASATEGQHTRPITRGSAVRVPSPLAGTAISLGVAARANMPVLM